ncbi:MAG: lysoplasmalogenase [Myxococcota bacterium]|nr:lysoplasmalogenase [Myxococcota bacterium]
MIELSFWDLPAAVCLVSMLAMLFCEFKLYERGIATFKVIASTAFVIAGYFQGGEGTFYGTCILAALILSWWGDVFLLSKSEPVFKLGILAFLLGHVAYVVAFAQSAFSWTGAAAGLGVVGLIALLVGRWLIPKLESGMRPAVIAYITVISIMVVFASALSVATMHFQVLLGATMFFVSDLAVAKHRFVSPGFANKIWGLPLYYGAQIILVYTI